MAKALIIGAGAIGRGFLPWVLQNSTIDIFDSSINLVKDLKANKGFYSFMSHGDSLSRLWVEVSNAESNLRKLVHNDYDVVFIAVGPRNILDLPKEISELKCPIFSLENDPITVDWIKDKYGLQNVFFGVPDVITSSTASPKNLELDPNSLHTENGVLYLQDTNAVSNKLRIMLPDVVWLPVDKLNEEWDAKLYIHNTPHCIAAYLGYLCGCNYLHEALSIGAIKRVLDGVVDELLTALKINTSYDHHFIESYAIKEVRRFSNKLLFDPIERVAREPLRKLHPSGRLTGALSLLLLNGVRPTYLMIGIAAALQYKNENDMDFDKINHLDDFGVSSFMKYHLEISPSSLESEYISQNLASAKLFLDREIK